jgi:hypothetical protein
MYESGKLKRKRKPHPQQARSSKVFMIAGLLMLAVLIGGVSLLIASISSTTQVPEPHELTATLPIAINQTVIAFGQQTATAAAIVASATPLPQVGETTCTWHITTRADPNGLTPRVQQKLDQALLPADVRAMVYLTGDECLGENELETSRFSPRHTDFYLLVRVDGRFLNANIEDDIETRAQLGFLVRQILNVLDADFTPDKTAGSESGIITMTFINGDVVRSASFTQDELAISRYNEYEAGTAVIAAIGGLQRP